MYIQDYYWILGAVGSGVGNAGGNVSSVGGDVGMLFVVGNLLVVGDPVGKSVKSRKCNPAPCESYIISDGDADGMSLALPAGYQCSSLGRTSKVRTAPTMIIATAQPTKQQWVRHSTSSVRYRPADTD
jgi:hypothetical protein